MDEPLDETYLNWLYNQVASVTQKNPARTYWSLMKQLYKTEFFDLIPNDDNRVEDGRDLRKEFFNEYGMNRDPEWMGFGCSVLEMLLGLSRRLAYETDGEARDWFWQFLKNLQLLEYSDLNYRFNTDKTIAIILDRLIQRTYDPSGHGGLFPLNYPEEDQRTVEIWYQQAIYLMERE